MYRTIEVELALMYDMLYTKAQVIHTWYGYCTRAASLVCCFVALRDIVITFALLGGACALEMASVIKAIGSTWTWANLRRSRWKWLANAILYARYHLVVIKDGRWSNSVGQYNLMSFCVYSNKRNLMGRIADWIGLRVMWIKAHRTKHAKLSPAMKEFVWGLIKGEKSHMVQIEDVAIRSGYWARAFRGFHQSEQLDWSMSFEFQKSVLIWHIATSTFFNDPAIKLKLVDEDMAETVNTLSDYMLYLIVEHPDILPVKAVVRNLFDETFTCYTRFLKFFPNDWDDLEIYSYIGKHLEKTRKLHGDWTQAGWDAYRGEAVLVKACALAMVEMKLGLTHKMVIIGTAWTEMLRYTATNASGDFHARQLSNGGEFLTHILLITQYSTFINKNLRSHKLADETVEASAAEHIQLNVDDGSDDEITEIR